MYGALSSFPLHVISADSMQVYRYFDVGTATPSPERTDLFPHTGINDIDPSEEYSVARFLEKADRAVADSQDRGRLPVVVGGTGLYLKAFLYGLDEMPPRNERLRQRLRRRVDEHSREHLHGRLREVDPRAAEKIHPNDVKRVIRALEIYYQTGRTKTELTGGETTLRGGIDPVILGLDRPRAELRDRIHRRAESMVEGGLIEEVRRLRSEWDPSRTLRQAIGFGETIRYLEDEIDRSTLVERITDNTIGFVRKQRNWFQKFPVRGWYHPDEDREELIHHIESQCKQFA